MNQIQSVNLIKQTMNWYNLSLFHSYLILSFPAKSHPVPITIDDKIYLNIIWIKNQTNIVFKKSYTYRITINKFNKEKNIYCFKTDQHFPYQITTPTVRQQKPLINFSWTAVGQY